MTANPTAVPSAAYEIDDLSALMAYSYPVHGHNELSPEPGT
jgi:hypothetical protein